MDIATLAGICMAFGGVVLGILIEGGHLGAFFSISSGLIVLGGSLGATTIGNTMSDLRAFPKRLMLVLKPPEHQWDDVVKDMVDLAVTARRDGLLSLESAISGMRDDFTRTGLRLIVDGADSEVLDYVLEARLEVLEHEGKQGEKFFEQLGGFCPTLGIVGTVTGLIHVLGNLSEPSKLGASIATAFVATLYGIAFANLLFLPCANKLKMQHELHMRYYRMISAALLAIQAGENPLVTEEKMRCYIGQHEQAASAGKAPGGAHATATAVA